MNKLIEKAITLSSDEFYKVEADIFMSLYKKKCLPPFALALLGLSSWKGSSLRSGVWTYYEATEKQILEGTIQYLQEYAPLEEITKMYTLGNHDYSDEKYHGENYPQAWLDESEVIDVWITSNENEINSFLLGIIRKNIAFFKD